MLEIKHYIDNQGRDIYAEWHRKIRDTKARMALDRRLYRVELGNFGDHKAVGEGVHELRVDVGPGYRVYYGQSGKTLVLLLCGGDKSTQRADIKKAQEYWQDWQRSQSKEKGVER